ncbi:MAG: hypothetical protein ACK56F_12675, partial [bacterium]
PHPSHTPPHAGSKFSRLSKECFNVDYNPQQQSLQSLHSPHRVSSLYFLPKGAQWSFSLFNPLFTFLFVGGGFQYHRNQRK